MKKDMYIVTLRRTLHSKAEVERTNSYKVAATAFMEFSRRKGGAYSIYVDKVVGDHLVRQMRWGPEVRAELGIPEAPHVRVSKKQAQLKFNPEIEWVQVPGSRAYTEARRGDAWLEIIKDFWPRESYAAFYNGRPLGSASTVEGAKALFRGKKR